MDFLHEKTLQLAHSNPELRKHLVPVLRQAFREDPVMMGETHEVGTIRFHVFRHAIKVWDLTNAGKRGKGVRSFTLYDLDRVVPPDSMEGTKYKLSILTFPQKLLQLGDFDRALNEAETLMVIGQEGGFGLPSLEEYLFKGIEITPGGTTKFERETPEFSITADPREGYSIRDKRDQANFPACIDRGGKRDIARFYKWVSENWPRLEKMTFEKIVSTMHAEGFRTHQYCTMD